jgi:peptidoglycan/LPS O-acetylase OafA/YrhL
VIKQPRCGGQSLSRLKFLDGLRGWAAIVVVLYHVFCDAIPFDAKLGSYLKLFLPFSGAMAIFIFFLVSGFSLSSDYLARGNMQSWARTTVGRYFRLSIPIFFACAFVHFAMLVGWIDPPSTRLTNFQDALTFEPTIGHLLRFSFYGVFFDYHDSYIGPLWTMRLELIGSFIALFAALLFRSAPYRPLIFSALATLILLFAPNSDYALLALFPIGCALADCFQRGWIFLPASIGATLICIAIIIPLFIPFSVASWGAIGATSLVFGCISVPAVRRLLETPFSVRLGDMCFPLYLIHGPIIWLIGEPLMMRFGQDLTSRILIDGLTIVVSVLAAAAVVFSPAKNLAITISRWIGYSLSNLFFAKIQRSGSLGGIALPGMNDRPIGTISGDR